MATPRPIRHSLRDTTRSQPARRSWQQCPPVDIDAASPSSPDGTAPLLSLATSICRCEQVRTARKAPTRRGSAAQPN